HVFWILSQVLVDLREHARIVATHQNCDSQRINSSFQSVCRSRVTKRILGLMGNEFFNDLLHELSFYFSL
ncbi:MAG: hypothetical protein KDA72_22030, partial [Planctomycetales bacterium]|nr:hypothetical protein [Planctomycetales bacterium]